MTHVVHLVLSLPCSPDEAYRYFTEASLVEAWLAKVAIIEPQPGGPYELYWEHDPHDTDINNRDCHVRAAVPGKLLVIEWPAPGMPGAEDSDPLSPNHVTFAFFPGKAGDTELHLVHSGYVVPVEGEELGLWRRKMWQAFLDSLVALVKARAS